jgi:AraC-like DNA-binding protein
MILYIKNMVSHSCILVVKGELEKLGIAYTSVKLGEIEVADNLEFGACQKIADSMQQLGFGLLLSRKQILLEKIKTIIIELVHHSEDDLKFRYSDHISSKLNHHYKYLSTLFSKEMGLTIEEYIIAQKIERVKELMAYEDLNLTEIAFKAHYSSASHLSKQFKKITGVSPSDYKKLNMLSLTPIEEVGIAV